MKKSFNPNSRLNVVITECEGVACGVSLFSHNVQINCDSIFVKVRELLHRNSPQVIVDYFTKAFNAIGVPTENYKIKVSQLTF